MSSSFTYPRSCPFTSSSSSSSSASSSSTFSTFSSSSSSSSSNRESSLSTQSAPNTSSSPSFQSASKYSYPTSSTSLPDTHYDSHNHTHSHSRIASPTPTPTPTSSPTVNIINIPSLSLIKCIQSCLSNSKSNDSPSNRTLVKSTLLYWNLENNNCHFENKKQNLSYNNVQIYPNIADQKIVTLEDEVIDLCSDSPTKSRASHTNRVSNSNSGSNSNSSSNSCSNSDRNRNGKGNENENKVDYRPSPFFDLSSSSSSYPSSSSYCSSTAYPPPSRINPFEISSLQQSENILFLVASNKSSTCLDVEIILATANYNNTCPFSRKICRNNHQNIQVPLPYIPLPIPIPLPPPHPNAASSSAFMAPLNIKKKPCDEYSVMFRLPPHSNRLVGIFISVPLGQAMSPLNSDFLNAVTGEEQIQGQGQWQGLRQDGLDGGRSSRIRILSTHCTDAYRTASPSAYSGTGPGRHGVSEPVRDTVTIDDSNYNAYADRGSVVIGVGGSDRTAAATGAGAGSAGAENHVRNCRITTTFSSCPDHFKPFYLPRL